MRPPCELVNKFYLPQLRARISRELVEKYGWNMRQVAKTLKVSSTAVSRYKRITKERSRISSNFLDEFAKNLANKIAKNEVNDEEFIRQVCSNCLVLRLEGDVCKIHRKEILELKNCRVCSMLFVEMENIQAERLEVIEELNSALKLLSSYHNFDLLIPEVRTNIVMCVKSPKGLQDVAAFPGRITSINGRAAALSQPEFQASKHISKILLAMNKKNQNVKASMCIKFNDEIEKTMKEAKLKYIIMDRAKYNDIAKFIEDLSDNFDAVVDPGEKNVEPVAYIFGNGAINVVKKVLDLTKFLEKEIKKTTS
ncbi:MAG: thiamine-phosphate synthase family protein [Thermoproteota archaeon]|nr:hypothetical protein [Candidatus Brockarchaeota archaeon]MBO3767939.1 hypothetical protein [Candidatus Brockarchaeota archaeon]MBO3801231.1 hypothetical protein [Candidatus Brockarchaeota archaeon]